MFYYTLNTRLEFMKFLNTSSLYFRVNIFSKDISFKMFLKSEYPIFPVRKIRQKQGYFWCLIFENFPLKNSFHDNSNFFKDFFGWIFYYCIFVNVVKKFYAPNAILEGVLIVENSPNFHLFLKTLSELNYFSRTEIIILWN